MKLETNMSMGGKGEGAAVIDTDISNPIVNLGIPSANVSEYMNDLSKHLSARVALYLQSLTKLEKNSKFEYTEAQLGKSCSGLTVEQAGPGLITGRIDLVGWATQKRENFGTPAGVAILKACFVSMINGTMGQRGLLMRKIQVHNIGLRCIDMLVDFSVWLPATERKDGNRFYANCVKDAMNRLSLQEIQQYFPSFLFGSTDTNGKSPELAKGSMVSMPMAAPAAVPEENDAPPPTSPSDACEMLFCTTKQKKRKGVPYCGTCRKFMEETVKWYCDAYKVHPAKEKEKFVPAVHTQRYGCKHPKVGSNCDCKSCHSLRRFDELYPNCEGKLDEFKRRTFMFNDRDTVELAKTSLAKGNSARAKANAHTNKPPPRSNGNNQNSQQHKSTSGGASSQAWKNANDINSPNPFINLGISPKDKVKPGDIFPSFGPPEHTRPQSNSRKRKQPVQQAASQIREHLRRRSSSKDPIDTDIIPNLLPNYILPTPSPHVAQENNFNRESSGPSFLDSSFEMDADALYRAMYMEDPDTFSGLDPITQSVPTMNTWLCSLCAVWNHRSRDNCQTCGTKR